MRKSYLYLCSLEVQDGLYALLQDIHKLSRKTVEPTRLSRKNKAIATLAITTKQQESIERAVFKIES